MRDFPSSFAHLFFVNAGLRFITETRKMRAFTELWGRDRPRALAA